MFKGIKICREMSSTISGAAVKENLGSILFLQIVRKLSITDKFLYFKGSHVPKLYQRDFKQIHFCSNNLKIKQRSLYHHSSPKHKY